MAASWEASGERNWLRRAFQTCAVVFCQTSVVFTSMCKLRFWASVFCTNMTAVKCGIGDSCKTTFKEWRNHAVAYMIWRKRAAVSTLGTPEQRFPSSVELMVASHHAMSAGQKYLWITCPKSTTVNTRTQHLIPPLSECMRLQPACNNCFGRVRLADTALSRRWVGLMSASLAWRYFNILYPFLLRFA